MTRAKFNQRFDIEVGLDEARCLFVNRVAVLVLDSFMLDVELARMLDVEVTRTQGFILYGLRAGEATRLKVEDVDFDG